MLIKQTENFILKQKTFFLNSRVKQTIVAQNGPKLCTLRDAFLLARSFVQASKIEVLISFFKHPTIEVLLSFVISDVAKAMAIIDRLKRMLPSAQEYLDNEGWALLEKLRGLTANMSAQDRLMQEIAREAKQLADK